MTSLYLHHLNFFYRKQKQKNET